MVESNISQKSYYARGPEVKLSCNSLCGPLPKYLESPGLYEFDRQSHTRRRRCHSWKLQDKPFALLCADELVLHAWIFSTGPSARIWSNISPLAFDQHAFDRFNSACDQAGTKISTEKIEVLCLSRRPRQCILQVRGNALQQVETFKYLRVVFTCDGNRNKEIDTRIGKENTVLREFCCSVVAKREFSKPQSFQFLNRFLFRSSPVLMNLRWRLKEYCQKNKRQRWDICEEFSVWHFVIKSTGLKSVKPGMPTHFSESRDPSYVSSAMCPECPRKDWRSKPFGLQSIHGKAFHGKAAQTSSKDHVAWLHLRFCSVPPQCGASRTIWDCCWSWGISRPPKAVASQVFPKEDRARKRMNEWVCRPTLKLSTVFMKFSLVCLPKVNVCIQIIKHIGTQS